MSTNARRSAVGKVRRTRREEKLITTCKSTPCSFVPGAASDVARRYPRVVFVARQAQWHPLCVSEGSEHRCKRSRIHGRLHLEMSAYDPKRTSRGDRPSALREIAMTYALWQHFAVALGRNAMNSNACKMD